MIRFIQNILYLSSMAAMVAFGVAVFYFRTHGIDNQITSAGYLLGFAMAPVSFFVQRP